MSESKAIVCPNCRRLISNYVESCPYCGLSRPNSKARIVNTLGGGHVSFVRIIIVVNVVFFILSYLLPFIFSATSGTTSRGMFGIPGPGIFALDNLGAAYIYGSMFGKASGISQGEWWRLVNSVFLHGGPIHILFNMLWVRDLGTPAERLLSPQKMLIIFIVSGIVGNLTAVFLPVIAGQFGIRMSSVLVIGASGAVFGLMGGFISYGRKIGGFQGRAMARQLWTWAMVMIVLGFLIPRISNSAHIGGLVAGLALGQIMPVRDSFFSKQFYSILSLVMIGVCVGSFVMALNRLIAIF